MEVNTLSHLFYIQDESVFVIQGCGVWVLQHHWLELTRCLWEETHTHGSSPARDLLYTMVRPSQGSRRNPAREMSWLVFILHPHTHTVIPLMEALSNRPFIKNTMSYLRFIISSELNA